MPQINELVLRVSGRRRGARFIVTGVINYDDSDLSRNGVYVFFNFNGRDGLDTEIIRGRQLWTTRGRTTNENEGLDSWSFIPSSPTRTRFEIIFRNQRSRPSRRSFNEDRPGRDEVFCWVQIRDADGTLLTDGQDSNTVSGRF